MKRKSRIVIYLSIVVLISSLAFYCYQVVKSPNFLVQEGDQDSYLLIPESADFKTVLDSLQEKNIINDITSFAFLAKLLKYQENVKPGRYLIKKKMTNLEAVRMLRAGLQTPVKVSFHALRLKKELSERITRHLQIDAEEFLAAINNNELIGKYGFDSTNIMCMFIPDTYEVYWNINQEALLDKMHRHYEKFWTEERLERAEQLKLNPIEVSVLASIVEAETAKNDEKPTIAGVYINRLKRRQALQADPTLIYAWQDYSIRRVLNRHKEIDSPYNTYKNIGLPPGPINLPSIASIDAVLHYEKHDYLFFCAKEDRSGYHAFASTHREHINNARRYQKALNQSGIYQ